MTGSLEQNIDPASLLAWHIAMGADEAIDMEPVDRFVEKVAAPTAIAAPPQEAIQRPQSSGPTKVAARPTQPMTGAGADEAMRIASKCNSMEELQNALVNFDGGLVKRSAKNTVFADGVAGSPLMVIGDVPSRDDDQSGKPFSGPAGDLLDKMLAAIGLNRSTNVYLSNVVPWRLLGNSKPEEQLLSVCRPFLERHIALAGPKLVFAMGGALGKTLTNTQDSISRQRGKWRELSIEDKTINCFATYHPTYLLSQPHQKGAAWRDLLEVKEKLSS